MTTAYQRRKQPAAVRAALLAAAGDLACRQGIPALTLQAVAEAAGVTKGGLLHHFASKEVLIAALGDAVMAGFTRRLDGLIAADPVARGRFTRAYVRACLETAPEDDAPAPLLIAALWSDPGLRRQWYDWLAEQEARHAATDGDDGLRLIRYAADGVWLALTDGRPVGDWSARLIAATAGS